MSTQRGNVSRTRSQKYQNKTKFKNDLHDTSHTIKSLNKLEIVHVCNHCKGIIEWKIKFKKYKQLKNPSTCVSCHNKNVKHAYHTLCSECALKRMVCPKCGKEKKLVETQVQFNPEEVLKSGKVKSLMQALTERKRRMVYRLLERAEENDLCSEEKLLAKLENLQLNSGESVLAFDDLDGLGFSDNSDES